jgi:hypothetical protein
MYGWQKQEPEPILEPDLPIVDTRHYLLDGKLG